MLATTGFFGIFEGKKNKWSAQTTLFFQKTTFSCVKTLKGSGFFMLFKYAVKDFLDDREYKNFTNSVFNRRSSMLVMSPQPFSNDIFSFAIRNEEIMVIG